MMQNLEVTTTNIIITQPIHSGRPFLPTPLLVASLLLWYCVDFHVSLILCTIGGGFANYGKSQDEEVSRTF